MNVPGRLRGAGRLALALLGCSSDCDLDDDVRLFAGDIALDCGTASEEQGRSDVDTCAANAFVAGTAFIARYQLPGIDSQLVTAVASNTSGKVMVFRWASSACGNGSSCSPVTDAQVCEGPSVELATSDDPSALPISCSSLGQPLRVCE